jgi:tetratricopeptide (TPR) repeat protein
VPNLHQALRSSLEDGFAVQTLALSLATESHWERRGVPPEIRALWLAALEALKPIDADLDDAASAQVQAARCLFARRLFETGDAVTAVALADQAVADARSRPAWIAAALAVQLRLRWKLAPTVDTGVSEALFEALTFADSATHARPRAELLNLLAESLVLGRKDAEAAMPYYEQALDLFERLGDARQAWDVRMGQGICAQMQGRYGDAIAIHTEVAAAAQRLDDQLLLVDAYNNLAVACNHAHRWDEAVHYGRHQLRLATRQYSSYMQVMALWNLARPLARSHQPEASALAMAASTHAWVTQYGALAARDERYVAKVKRLVQRQAGSAQAAAWWDSGTRRSLGEVVDAVLHIEASSRAAI